MGFHHPRGWDWVVSAPDWQIGAQLRALPLSTRFRAVSLTETLALNFQKESSATAIPLSQRSVQLWWSGQRNLRAGPTFHSVQGCRRFYGDACALCLYCRPRETGGLSFSKGKSRAKVKMFSDVGLFQCLPSSRPSSLSTGSSPDLLVF